MASAGNMFSDADPVSLKRLLSDTAAACQKCLVAVDNVNNQRPLTVSTEPVSLVIQLSREHERERVPYWNGTLQN